MNINYKQIFSDIIAENYPEKIGSHVLKRRIGNIRNVMDVIFLNNFIFGGTESTEENQKLRSYDKDAILCILEYQKKNKLNNSQVAIYFNLSRNTISKWRKTYFVRYVPS